MVKLELAGELVGFDVELCEQRKEAIGGVFVLVSFDPHVRGNDVVGVIGDVNLFGDVVFCSEDCVCI